jgi:hypothetical protein
MVQWVMQSRQARPSLIRAGSSLSDIVLVIATALNKEGICAVLTGEAAAAMHLRGALRHDRVSYTLTPPVAASRLASAIRHLGFEGVEGGHYRHAGIDTVLEVTQAPLSIGRDTKVIAQTLQLRHGFVRILSPTDCCRQQMLLWTATSEDSRLQRAVDLAKRCDINMPDMRTWMRKEGLQTSWPDFKRAVAGTLRPYAAAEPAQRLSRPR